MTIILNLVLDIISTHLNKYKIVPEHKHHLKKTYGLMQVESHEFLNVALEESE